MRYVFGIVFAVMAALPYAIMVGKGTESRPEPSAGAAEVLTVISPHRREVRQEYDRAFDAWMKTQAGRNVKILWLDVGGTSKILKDLESRYATNPDAMGVDVLFGGGVDPYLTAKEQGWLAPLTISKDTLDAIPATCGGVPVYDPEGYWFGVALSGFGIIYNRRVTARMGMPEPRTWEDLARPEFFTWVASGDPRSSGSVHMCYEIILQAKGFEAGWGVIARICANVRNFGEGGGVAPREVAAGEVAAGMVIDQYAQTVIDLAGPDKLGFVLPPGSTMIGADAIGLLKGAPASALGQEFIEFVLSDAGQRVLFRPAGTDGQEHSLHRMPVRQALYEDPSAPAARPYEYRGAFEYQARKASRRRKILGDLIGVWLIDAHEDLAAAWGAVIRTALREDLVRELCAAPIREEEEETLAEDWKDPRKRLATMNAWAEAATRRYRAIQEKAGE